ncbi:MAG TPA: aquaporin [Gemmatales bacterium]|mgnify:CR=1 FL=1|nr:aquaporin [Gemmatales bacterium]
MKRYLTELIGTFFLVFTIGLAVTAKLAFAELAIGSVLMVMVYMGGHVSGAHYNPAVSLAVMERGKLGPIDFVAYVVSQLAGALLAAYVVFIITGKTFGPAPSPEVTGFIAILVEAIFTFALALVVLNVATAKGTEGNSFYGLAIGFTIFVAATVGGGISGGAFNPAVGFGPLCFQHWMEKGTLDQLGYYIVGPFLGAAVAAAVFWIQNAEWSVSLDKK